MTECSPYLIREAEAGDIAAIDQLIGRVWDDRSTDLKCLPGESRFTSKELPQYLHEPSNSTMVYVQPDGCIGGVLFLSAVAPTVVELGISAFPYGLGAGTKLIEHAIDAATKGGITEIYLDVFERNPAVELYRRSGFSIFDRQFVTNQRGEELPLLRMRRALKTTDRQNLTAQPGCDSDPGKSGSSIQLLFEHLMNKARKFLKQ